MALSLVHYGAHNLAPGVRRELAALFCILVHEYGSHTDRYRFMKVFFVGTFVFAQEFTFLCCICDVYIYLDFRLFPSHSGLNQDHRVSRVCDGVCAYICFGLCDPAYGRGQ